ncbi:MAG: 30S ribosomal protein S15 [Candidatus Gastranaerophilaceae bacterium]
MSINLKNKTQIVEKFGKDAKDTGSAQVQIALLSEKINELTEHLKINKKDFQCKRGLLMMVGKRKRLLSYLNRTNLELYRKTLKDLKLRG